MSGVLDDACRDFLGLRLGDSSEEDLTSVSVLSQSISSPLSLEISYWFLVSVVMKSSSNCCFLECFPLLFSFNQLIFAY